MSDRIVPIADSFWNVRGSFKLGGRVDIGTQCSLAQLADGSYALLDAYTLEGEVKERIFAKTNDGRDISSVIHLHPFHTTHVAPVAAQLPHAVHYGSARHRSREPDLKWSTLSVETDAFRAHFAADFEFSIPRGMPFISDDPRLHFSSVLAIHRASRTLHVDDTLGWNPIPGIRGVGFHPTLALVLERRPGAASEFRGWAKELASRARTIDHIVTAHPRTLPPAPRQGSGLEPAVRRALKWVEPVLAVHERRWGA